MLVQLSDAMHEQGTRCNRFAMFLWHDAAAVHGPPIVDEGGESGHDGSPVEIVGRESAPAPVVLQLPRRPGQSPGVVGVPVRDQQCVEASTEAIQPNSRRTLGAHEQADLHLAAQSDNHPPIPESTPTRHHLREEPCAVIPPARICAGMRHAHGAPCENRTVKPECLCVLRRPNFVFHPSGAFSQSPVFALSAALTSYAYAYYVPETHSAKAEHLLDSNPQRVISPLVLTEVSSALRRKIHDKTLPRADAQTAWEDFKQDVATGIFRLTELERRHFDHAAAQIWQTKDRLRTLDAVHLAVADLDGLTLVTADDLMAKVGKDLGIKVRWAGA